MLTTWRKHYEGELEYQKIDSAPTYLVVDYVIRAFIDTLTVWAILQGITNILDIRNAIHDGGSRPARASPRNGIEVDYA